MTCHACKLDHPPLMRCEVARRLAINVSAINRGAINNGSAGSRDVAVAQGASGDEICKPERGHHGHEKVIRGQNPNKGKKYGRGIEARRSELPGAGVHQEVEKGGRTLPGEKDSASVSPKTLNRRSREDYNAYMREYMRKRRGR